MWSRRPKVSIVSYSTDGVLFKISSTVLVIIWNGAHFMGAVSLRNKCTLGTFTFFTKHLNKKTPMLLNMGNNIWNF